MLTLDMVREAQEALQGIARRTPLDPAPRLGENIYIKAENLQLTGAFKLSLMPARCADQSSRGRMPVGT